MKKMLNRSIRLTGKIIALVLSIIVIQAHVIVAEPSVPVNLVNDGPPVADIMVTGKVVDENGIGLPGVSILVKGTTKGTISDIDGLYALEVPEDGVLVFSFIGYKPQEIPVQARSTIDVEMREDVAQLGEVVVVGYGVQKKESLTAAVANIGNEDIQTTQHASLAQKLQGKVPGLQIRQNAGQPGTFDNDISIRGFGQPIYVIDGIRREGSREFQQLNGNDIESISVLKDAAAAIYGLGAANGVILVTTKKGDGGRPQFNFSSLWGFGVPTDIPKMANAQEYHTMWNESIYYSTGEHAYPQEELDRLLAEGTGTDWYDEVFKPNSFQQQYNLSVSGGTEKTNYFISFGFVDNGGLLKSNDIGYNRYNFRSNITTELFDGLEAQVLVQGRWSKNWQPGSNIFNILKGTRVTFPYETPYANNDPTKLARVTSGLNPVAFADRDVTGYGENLDQNFQSSVALTYTFPFVKGLSIKGLASYDANNYMGKNLARPYNLYTYNPDDDIYVVEQQRAGVGNLNESIANRAGVTLQGFIMYNNTFASDHDVNVTAVVEQNTRGERRFNVMRRYAQFYTKDQLRFADAQNQESDGIESRSADLSYLGRANYAFRNKYLVEFAGRYMGTHRYGPSNRWGFYPMGSLGWLISEEGFMDFSANWLSMLKLRGSYGVVGQPEGSAFQYVPGFTLGSGGSYEFVEGELTEGVAAPIPANENLTWQTARTANFGLDLGLFTNKVTFSADIFQRVMDGIPARPSVALPNTYGGELAQENLNSEITQGYEIVLGYTDEFGDFRFNISGNVSFARTMRGHVEGEEFTNSWEKWRNQRSDRWNDLQWGYTYDGQYQDYDEIRFGPMQNGDQGNLFRTLPGDFRMADLNNDGVINGLDIAPLWTNANPKYFFGLNMNASFKGFDMNMLWQGASQFTVRFREVYAEMFAFRGNTPAYFYDRWRKADIYSPDSEWIAGEWPATRSNNAVGGYFYADHNVWRRDASFFRLKNVEIGYTISSPKLQEKAFIQSIRIFASGFNLITFTDPFVKPFDPEKVVGAHSSGFTYPLERTFNFGLNVNF